MRDVLAKLEAEERLFTKNFSGIKSKRDTSEKAEVDKRLERKRDFLAKMEGKERFFSGSGSGK